jgi:head-tail adaptor
MATTWTAPGERRRKVTIQRQSTGTRTGMGFLPGAWADVLTTWAKVTVKNMTAFAAVIGGEPVSKNLFLLNIRFPPGIDILSGMRVADGTDFYRIQNVTDVDERHRELILTCSQIPDPAAETQ